MSRTFQVGDLLPPAPAHGNHLPAVPLQRGHLEPAPHPLRRNLCTRGGPPRPRAALPPAGGARPALRHRGPRPGVAGHEGLLPAAQAGLRAGRPGLHRPGHRGRGRQPDPRAHRGEPLRRGRVRGDGVGQQDHGRAADGRLVSTAGAASIMTTAAGRGQRPIRIGNCSGFYGDRASAMADMARAGGIDVLTGDYLAEVTMLILGKARAKDASTGYATTFLQHLDAALEHLVANGIRLVVNAGGLNPAGLAAATRELIARRGYDLRVSHVDGDDVFGRLDALQQAGHALPHLTSGEPLSAWPHRPLTANAYLGGFGIARALRPRRRHRHHRSGRRRLAGRRCRRLVVELDPARLRRAGRRGVRRPRHRMRAAGHRRQLLRVSEPFPTSSSPGSRSPRSPPTAPA